MNLYRFSDQLYDIFEVELLKIRTRFAQESVDRVKKEWPEIGQQVEDIKELIKESKELYDLYLAKRNSVETQLRALNKALNRVTKTGWYVDNYSISHITLDYVITSVLRDVNSQEVTEARNSYDTLKRFLVNGFGLMKTGKMASKYMEKIFARNGIDNAKATELINELKQN